MKLAGEELLFFGFLTCYWAAEKLKNDNLSSA
jgi:hypothetical protein